MKRTILIALFWNSFLSLYPQCNDLNCTFFMDSKFVNYVNFKVMYNNNDLIDTVNFDYYLCTLSTDIDDFEKIKSLPDSTILQMQINYLEVDKNFHRTYYCFSHNIRKNYFLKMKIINIITFDKMKKKYFINILGDGFETAFEYKKAYGSKRKFVKKFNKLF